MAARPEDPHPPKSRGEEFLPERQIFKPPQQAFYLLDRRDWTRLTDLAGGLSHQSGRWLQLGWVLIGAGVSGLLGSLLVGGDVDGTRLALFFVISLAMLPLGWLSLKINEANERAELVTPALLKSEMATMEQGFVASQQEAAVVAQTRDELSEQLQVTLSQAELDRFMLNYVNLVQYEELAMATGGAIWNSPRHSRGHYGVKFRVLNSLLSVIGVNSIGALVALLDELPNNAMADMIRLNRASRQHGTDFAAVGEDVLVCLISMAESDRLPAGYDWGGAYREPLLRTLREVCGV